MCSVVLDLVKSHGSAREIVLSILRCLMYALSTCMRTETAELVVGRANKVGPGILPLLFVKFRDIVQPFPW